MGRPGLEHNRKFIYLLMRVESRALALGVLEAMWRVAYESGNPLLGSPDMVEYICGWTELGREPNVLFTALRDAGKPKHDVGFIERVPGHDDVWQIHDLLENAPQYVRTRRRREEERKRVAAIEASSIEAIEGLRRNLRTFPGGGRVPR